MRLSDATVRMLRVTPVSVYEDGSYREQQGKKDKSRRTSHWVPVVTAVRIRSYIRMCFTSNKLILRGKTGGVPPCPRHDGSGIEHVHSSPSTHRSAEGFPRGALHISCAIRPECLLHVSLFVEAQFPRKGLDLSSKQRYHGQQHLAGHAGASTPTYP
jgi:hypothetical protein